MPTRARAVMVVVVVVAAVGGWRAPSAQGGFMFPLGGQFRYINIIGIGQQGPSSTLGDYEDSISGVLGPADSTGQPSNLTITQRSILRSERIEVTASLTGYRAMAALNPGIQDVSGVSLCTITFNILAPTEFIATFTSVVAQGLGVDAVVRLSGPNGSAIFDESGSRPPIIGVLPAGQYRLDATLGVSNLQGGAGSAALAFALDVPPPTAAAGIGIAAGLVGLRRLRRGESE